MEQLQRYVREHADAHGVFHINAAADAARDVHAFNHALIHVHCRQQCVDRGVDRALGADEIENIDLVEGDFALRGGFLRESENVAPRAVMVAHDAAALADEQTLRVDDAGAEQLGDGIDDAAAAKADGLLSRLADNAEGRLHAVLIDDAGFDRAVRCAHTAGDVAALKGGAGGTGAAHEEIPVAEYNFAVGA